MTRLTQALARTQLAQLRGDAVPMRDVAILLCGVTLEGHAATRLLRAADEPAHPDQNGPQSTARQANALLHPLGVQLPALNATQTGELRGLLLLIRVAQHLQAGELNQALRIGAAQSVSTRELSSAAHLTPWHPALQAADLICHPNRASLPWHAGSWPEQQQWWPALRGAARASVTEHFRLRPNQPLDWQRRPGLLGQPAPLDMRGVSGDPDLRARLRHWTTTHLTAVLNGPLLNWNDLTTPMPVTLRPGQDARADLARLMTARASAALSAALLDNQPATEARHMGQHLRQWAGAQVLHDRRFEPWGGLMEGGPALAWTWHSHLHAASLLDHLARQTPQHSEVIAHAARTFDPEFRAVMG